MLGRWLARWWRRPAERPAAVPAAREDGTRQAVVDPDLYFWDPAERPPPLGRKIIMGTDTGTQVIGYWQVGMVGWRPCFRFTDDMKRQINAPRKRDPGDV